MEIAVKKPIALVGLMGAGKTAIGTRLAKRLDLAFLDIDDAVEKRHNMAVSDIFERLGEVQFRIWEREEIEAALSGTPKVIATGGGAFMQPDVRARLLESAAVVWLRAPLDVLVERVSRKQTRPLLEGGDKHKIMEKLMQERNPVYEQAPIVVDSSEGPHEKVVGAAIAAISAFQKAE